MNRHIILMSLLALTGSIIGKEATERQGNITLVAADGGKVVVPRDIANKITNVKNLIEDFEASEKSSEKVPIDGINNANALQFAVKLVEAEEAIYKKTPIIKKYPKFFEKTDKHPAYTPVDIPQQTSDKLREKLNQPLQQLLNNHKQREELIQAADYLAMDWMLKILNNPEITESKSIADAIAAHEFSINHDIKGKSLDFSGHGITDFTGIHVLGPDTLRKITVLSLSNNQIKEVQRGDLDGLVNLAHLYVNDNNITHIEPGAFNDLQRLKKLELTNNELENIQADTLTNLLNLQNIDLGFNNIKIIQPGAFNKLQRLKRLNLRFNKLENIQPGVFNGLQSLNKLDLEANNLDEATRNRIKRELPDVNTLL